MNKTIRWSLTLGVAVVVTGLLWAFTPNAGTTNTKQKEVSKSALGAKAGPYRSPGARHKVTASDEKSSAALLAQGARLIADYGSYKLFDASSDLSAKSQGLAGVETVDENNLVLLNSGTIDTTTSEAQDMRSSKAAGGVTGGRQMHLIQFAGPIKHEWYDALVATGVKIVTYIPNNAYLVYGDAKTIGSVRALSSRPYVQWDNPYTSEHRISPNVTVALAQQAAAQKGGSQKAPLANLSAKGNQLFAIQLVNDSKENDITLGLIDQLKLEPIVRQAKVMDYINVVVALPPAEATGSLADRGDVVSIAAWNMPHRMDERQDQIIAGNITGSGPSTGDYLSYLSSKGFTTTTTSFGVNISDSGIDNGSTTPNHFGLYALGNPTSAANSRVIYARVVGTPSGPGSTTQACDGHGNLNTHIISGYVPTGTVGGVNFGAAPHADAQGFRYGLGVLPFVKVGSSVIFDNSGAATGDFTNPNYTTLESSAYNDTMRISSNSWGASDNSYSIDSQEYDALVRDAQPTGAAFPAAGNQEYIILFAAGNDGSSQGTVGLPGTAKNVITVGAAEGVQAFGGADGCGTADNEADSVNDIVGFSSRGPTADGRRKPDIVAPGTHISGGVAQASIASPTGSGTGAQLACFNATGVCAGPGGSDFFPAGQQWYTASSGTSHSTPAMSGYAALIRQYFINNALTPPSPAMTKAMMMNTARYMNGTGANDSLPSNSQGMGEANFNNFFKLFTVGAIRRDEVAADKFTASGQQRLFTGTINSAAEPVRITLAWTDPPGPTSGNAFVNNLDLEVTVGGNTYKGNVFSGGNSVTGGVADIRNNVESVFVPAGVTGSIVVKVKATNIAGNGVPGDADALDQDFALVMANTTAASVPVLEGGTPTITAESCAPADSAAEPGETVTIDLPLTNSGTANTTNLVATLQATGGVTSPSGPQNYGALTAGGPAVTRPFTFTVDPSKTCGSDLVITLALQDGATNLGTVTFTLRIGTLGAPSLQLFSTGNISTAIPDSSSVEIPIVVGQNGAVADVNVRVRLNHTFDGDLVLELVAPDGTTVLLSQNRDTALGGGDNYGTGSNDCSGTPTVFDDSAATAIGSGLPPFAGSFRPETPLSDLNGKSITGTWKLRVTDTAAQDTGTVGCVTLEINRQAFVCCGISGTPIIGSGGAATLTAESVTPANNTPDPGETVTANFPVINTGDGPTTNLVGTMQTSGGVTPVTPQRTYGVVPPNGTPVSQPFTFVVNGSCGSTVTASIQFQDGAVNLGTLTYTFQLGTTNTATQTFSNATAIVVPGTGTGATTGAPASPYPSNITVSGITAPVSKVRVTLKNISHTFPDDVDVMLVGPTGRKFIILSDAGDTNDWVGATITLDDDAAAPLGDTASNQTGSFKPGNFGTVQDPFPAPAPAGPYLSPAPGGTETFASAFAGQDPNGTWSLYVVDDAATDVGTFAGGWDLTLVTSQPVCQTQTCSLVCPANITVPADASGTSAVVNYPAATPTGSCGVLGYDIPSGSTFPLGTTTVHTTGANAATCSFTVTVNPSGPSGTSLIISEFRERGPSGANDEFVELYNPSANPVTVSTSDASAGWAVVSSSDSTARFVIPNGTVIPGRGHYLGTNSVAYSLSGYATGNVTFTTDIPDNSGLALFNTATAANFTLANRLDAVGFTSSASLFKEGTGLPTLTPFSIDYSFVRDSCGKSGSITTMGACPSGGDLVDTGNNATDFYFVDTNGTSAGAGQRLGAPGPENLASPIQRNAAIPTSLTFPCMGASVSPNRIRDFTSDPANNSTFGTLNIRRTFTNNTGASVTRLRIRIIDLTTFPAPSGFADLRPRTSAGATGVASPCGGSVNIEGSTLEQPPSQPNGGGFNSSMAVSNVTISSVGKGKRGSIRGSVRPMDDGSFELDAPLTNGSSINVQFLMGIQQTGSFKFFINIEALP
ncbi:MAG TPA: S8 family serine peptidase [Pyrinomonadaceae bacterium]